NFAIVVTLMARLGAAHGLRCVPLAMADAVTLTQALVLEKALVTLHTDARMGAEAGDVPQPGPASPRGAALQGWLDAVLRTGAAPRVAARAVARAGLGARLPRGAAGAASGTPRSPGSTLSAMAAPVGGIFHWQNRDDRREPARSGGRRLGAVLPSLT